MSSKLKAAAAGPSKPKGRAASNPKKPVVAAKKKTVDSDMEDEIDILSPKPAPRENAPKRTARTQPKKYIEIESDDEKDDEGKDDTFMISD